jgi:dihydrofolate reductase
MRELLVTTFLTLDGVMQAPGGPNEDDSGEFAHGGWSVNYWDDLMGEVMNEATSKPFAMVLGRRTYDIMAAFWPTAPEEAGAKTFNEATKYVGLAVTRRSTSGATQSSSRGTRPTASRSSSRMTDPSCKCTAART